jgi:hypothetical protein
MKPVDMAAPNPIAVALDYIVSYARFGGLGLVTFLWALWGDLTLNSYYNRDYHLCLFRYKHKGIDEQTARPFCELAEGGDVNVDFAPIVLFASVTWMVVFLALICWQVRTLKATHEHARVAFRLDGSRVPG